MKKMLFAGTLLLLTEILLLQVSCDKNPSVENDITAPVITLTPLADSMYVGVSWVEPGYQCIDETDGDLTQNVTITGTVDTASIGTCTLSYAVSDEAGNLATASRFVTVHAAPNLFASYMFNGNAQDQSGNGLNGTVSGPLPTVDRFGNSGSAYSFDGVDDYIVVPSIASFPAGNTPKSLSGWFKSDAEPLVKLFFGLGTAAEKGSFQVGSSTINGGPDEFTVNGWGQAYDWKTGIQSKPYFNGKWHHCAVTYDTKTTTLYLDGEKKAESGSFTYNIDSTTGKIVIGMEIDLAGWAFKGDLDDVRIFSGVLTPQQVNALCLYNNWIPDTTNDTNQVVTGLTHTIEGVSGNLSLILQWNAVPNAFAYGVYYELGPVITDNALFRTATTNSKTFTTELTEGNQYTFAVTIAYQNGSESKKSEPLTVMFTPR